jgi:hypothetical protein
VDLPFQLQEQLGRQQVQDSQQAQFRLRQQE